MENIYTLINNIKKVSDVVSTMLEMYKVVKELKEEIVELKEEVTKLKESKVVVTKDLKERNIENRKFEPQMIRYIFYLNQNRNMSGYKISKMLSENPPFIYNILNRKIYNDVDVKNLTNDDNLMLG